LNTNRVFKTDHSFLKQDDRIPVKDIIYFIDLSNKSILSDEDRVIIEKLYSELLKSKLLPEWWTEQESSYLKNIKDADEAVKYIAFRYKFRVYPIDRVVSEFPLYVLIEPVSVCNLRCPFCFQVDGEFTRKPYAGVMKLDLFKRVVDECVENGTGAITMASRGEPTLHPKFSEMLEYLSGKFFEVKINTNGTRLTENICHAIFKNGVNDIVLSIDTEKKELFEVLRKNALFEDVLSNVKMLNRIRDDFYPNSQTVIRISGVKCMDEQDNESYVEFWEEWCDEITIQDIEERWDTYNNKINPDLATPCQNLWERFYVWHDGVCNPCDVDYKSKLTVGSLLSGNSIKSIWNSNEFKKLRLDHLSGLRSGYIPCDRCGVC